MLRVSRTINIFILIALAAISCWYLADGAIMNAWSIEYVRFKQAGSDRSISEFPPNHIRSRLWLARDALRQGDPELAQELVVDIGEQGDVDALLIFGDSLVAQGEYDEAQDVFLRAGNIQRLLIFAELMQAAVSKEHGLAIYYQIYEVDPEEGTLPLANALWSYEGPGSQEQAVNLLRQSIEQYPFSVHRMRWALQLGDFLLEQSKLEEAEAVYRLIIREYDTIHAYLGLGWILYGEGEGLDAAIAEFQKAVILFPENGEGYLAMGRVLVEEGRYEEADFWFAEAITREPDMNWWYLLRGNTARDAGNLDLAMNIYKETIALFPEWPPGYFEAAWAYRLNEQSEDSITMIETAIDLMDPPNVWYFVRAGLIYEWIEDYSAAFDAFTQASELDPSNTNSQNGLIRVENLIEEDR
jgi:tetratricopeptide (TPR) repeat protein